MSLKRSRKSLFSATEYANREKSRERERLDHTGNLRRSENHEGHCPVIVCETSSHKGDRVVHCREGESEEIKDQRSRMIGLLDKSIYCDAFDDVTVLEQISAIGDVWSLIFFLDDLINLVAFCFRW